MFVDMTDNPDDDDDDDDQLFHFVHFPRVEYAYEIRLVLWHGGLYQSVVNASRRHQRVNRTSYGAALSYLTSLELPTYNFKRCLGSLQRRSRTSNITHHRLSRDISIEKEGKKFLTFPEHLYE